MKIMFEKFFPDEYLGSTYKIPFEKLYEQGYRGVIFDIDNTLVPHGAPADERAKRLFQRLRELGFESCLLSNNQKKRVEMFNQEIQTHYIYNALKPARKNYLHAMEIMGTDRRTRCLSAIAFYRCMGRKEGRNTQHFSASDQSKRRDSDRFKAVFGEDCASFL